MILVAVTVVASLAVGWLRGGRVRNISGASIRAGWLAVAAAVAQAVHAVVSVQSAAVILTVLSQTLLLVFLWRNRYAGGALLVALGSTLNAAVIVANGAMPVSRDALIAVSRHPYEVLGRHRLLEHDDALPWLADVIALPLLRTVVSVGDVCLAAGVALLVVWLMRPAPRHAPGTGRED